MTPEELERGIDAIDRQDLDGERLAVSLERFLHGDAESLQEALGISKSSRNKYRLAMRNLWLLEASRHVYVHPGSDTPWARACALDGNRKAFERSKWLDSPVPPSKTEQPVYYALWRATKYGTLPISHRSVHRLLIGNGNGDGNVQNHN